MFCAAEYHHLHDARSSQFVFAVAWQHSGHVDVRCAVNGFVGLGVFIEVSLEDGFGCRPYVEMSGCHVYHVRHSCHFSKYGVDGEACLLAIYDFLYVEQYLQSLCQSFWVIEVQVVVLSVGYGSYCQCVVVYRLYRRLHIVGVVVVVHPERHDGFQSLISFRICLESYVQVL